MVSICLDVAFSAEGKDMKDSTKRKCAPNLGENLKDRPLLKRCNSFYATRHRKICAPLKYKCHHQRLHMQDLDCHKEDRANREACEKRGADLGNFDEWMQGKGNQKSGTVATVYQAVCAKTPPHCTQQ